MMEGLRGYGALGLLMTFVGFIMLARLIVIQTGRLKDPLLRIFERYRSAPYRYNSLRDMALYCGGGLGGLVLVAAHFTPLGTPWLLPMAMMWALALLLHALGGDLEPLLPKPRWFARFLRDTPLPERRRIAYAWLNITPSMRKHFNAHDEAFFAWVEMVTLAVISP